jgi:chemotaxis-related protein WspD
MSLPEVPIHSDADSITITDCGPPLGTIVDCWNTIGVMGDRSCPELTGAIHCRNCPVFAAAARTLFDRPAPAGYLAEWTRLLDSPGSEAEAEQDRRADAEAGRDGLGLVIFRLGAEWLALRAQVVVEVTAVHPVHRIPHRTSGILIGLANLRGQLHLCASLHGLLGVVPQAGARADADATPRMIVIRQGAESWVFTADEVLGVPRVPRRLLRNVPSTLANPTVSFSQSVLDWAGRSVGLLDEGRVFLALRSLGQ